MPARLISLERTVEVRKRGTSTWVSARRDMQLEQGDAVRTRDGGSAQLRLADGRSLLVKPGGVAYSDPSRPF
jgi:hypothetical protein